MAGADGNRADPDLSLGTGPNRPDMKDRTGCGRLRHQQWPKPVRRQPAAFFLMRSSTDLGMVVSKSRSLAHVGVIVMTTISS